MNLLGCEQYESSKGPVDRVCEDRGGKGWNNLCRLGCAARGLQHVPVLEQILHRNSHWNFGEGFWASYPLANGETSSREVLAGSSLPAGYWIPCAALFGVMDIPSETAWSPLGQAARMLSSGTSRLQDAQGVLLCCRRLQLCIKGMAPPAAPWHWQASALFNH